MQRRDFTINGLLLDPLDPACQPQGRVLDYVGGRADLDAGSFAPSAIPSAVSAKTSSACCAPSVSPHALDTRSNHKRWRPSSGWPRKFTR